MASKYILLLSLPWFCSLFVSAQNQTTIITNSKFLKDPDILVSNNSRFKMGFFSPDNSSNRYIGIWYNTYNSINDYDDPLEVVWVPNRDNPLNDSSGVLKVSELDGNLVLLNGQNMIFWSSNVHLGSNSSSIAQLEDTGNLVLVRDASDTAWQSFDHPTNAMFPQMKLSIDEKMNEKQLFKSWKSPSDPSSGRYTVGINLRRLKLTEVFIWDGDHPYWRSGPWNGNMFIGVPYMNPVPQDGISLVNDDEGKFTLSFSLANQSMLTYLVLNSDGNLVQKYWDSGNHKKSWIVIWKSRESECDIYGKCGSFGSCNSKKSPICGCLKGFKPKNKEEWNIGNWTSGCVRRTPLESCGSTRGKADGFLRLRNMKVPDHYEWVTSDDQQDCGRQCLGKCQCLAYSYNAGIGCMMWNTSLVDIQEFSSNHGVDLFIRLADSELGRSSKWKIILLVVMIMGITTTCVVMYFLWRCNISRRNGKKVVSKDKLVHPIMNPVELIQDLPLFSIEKLGIATNNFDETNKLGRGGFGPVYKGELEDGQEIAVKRLARSSGQGLQEFMNEVVLISKLQHMNLVRLLGCCVERDEKMLVYEYMPNKSLNALLFDSLHKETLDWKMRFNIIEGICRGLLYLHRDSRLRIIHRDLKASNILLDRDLNPKISDFGMARIFRRDEDQANTLRVVGTYGYMSPEYAMNGKFSEKSDVFSF